jgi:imidazolonepropionase-like amidohydrolase
MARRFAFLLAACAALGLAQQPELKALTGGTLIDGFGGKRLRNSVILLRGERIEKVGTVDSLPVPAAYEQISTEGMTVLPGLWDMHLHLLYGGYPNGGEWQRKYHAQFEKDIMPATAEQELMSGVTTARDLGAPLEMILNVKRRIAKGEIPGPTLYVAGPQIAPDTSKDQYFRLVVSGAADAKEKVRQLAEAGVDQIKVTDEERFSVDEVQAMVSEAHAHHLRVAAHARSLGEVRRGLAAGVDEFEHINLQDPEYPADIMTTLRERTAARTLYWTPTISLPLRLAYLKENPEAIDDPSTVRGYPPSIIADMRAAVLKWQPQPVLMAREITLRKMNQLRDAGVEFIVGTDAGQTGNSHSQSMWQELDAWVNELGMDPLLVIRRATYSSAVYMGAEHDSGSVSEGKYADIIAVRGDPLRHIDVLRNPEIIIKHGHRYK